MVAIFSARRFCILALLVFVPLVSFFQGGSPLLADDPGTPGRNNWEVNLGYTIDHQPSDNNYETPTLDLNYGWGDRVQLNYEMPYVFNTTNNEPLQSGQGDSKFGVKIRFFQDEKLGLNVGTIRSLKSTTH